MNAFYVRTAHPIIDYQAMLIEAQSIDHAEARCEELCGMQPHSTLEVSVLDENVEKFSEEFFEYVNRDRSNED